MRIIARIRRLFAAHRVQARVAEQQLDEYLNHLDEQLADVRGELSRCQGEEQRLVGLLATEQQHAQRMRNRASVALTNGLESLAREAATRYVRAHRQGQHYRQALAEQHVGITRLRQLLDVLEGKRLDIEISRRLFISRHRLAQARRAMAETLYGEQGRYQIEQAEDSVATNELFADAYQELTMASDPSQGLPQNITGEDPVDETLAQLRYELGLPMPRSTEIQDHPD